MTQLLPSRATAGLGAASRTGCSAGPLLFLLLLFMPPLLWLGIVYRRLAAGAAAAQLLFDRRVLRLHRLRVHAVDLSRELFQPANFDVILRTLIMAAAVTIASAVIAYPDRLFCRALCQRQMEGALLSADHAAAVVQLSGQGLCLEADPRQGGHHLLGGWPNCI